MGFEPQVVAFMAIAAAAMITLTAAAWKMRSQRRPVSGDFDRSRGKAANWLKRAAVHFFSRAVRRQWTLRYGLGIYLDLLSRRHEKLTVPGRFELPIDRCYIPLELRAGPTVEARHLLSRTGVMLLLGDPGSGKSALMSRIVRDLCARAKSDKDQFRLPVYAPMKDISSAVRASAEPCDTPESAFALLERWFDRNSVGPADLFESQGMLRTMISNSRNGLVVLFDGLDEINSEDIDAVTRFLRCLDSYLSTSRAPNLLIISGRPQVLAFAPALTDGSFPRLVTIELKPFTPAAIYSFLLRWPYPQGRRSVHEATRIFSQLRLSPTLVDACSNPLALAMFVNHDQRFRDLGPSGGSSQPDTRAAFFGEVIDYLMIRTRNTPGSRSPYRPFRQARTNFFVAVVDDHIRSKDDFNVIAHAKMIEHADLLGNEGQDVERVLLDLAKDTGIIVYDATERAWSFVHRLFLDYFLACSLSAAGKGREVENLFVHPLKTNPLRYLEGFYFACGLMASRNAPHLQAVLDAVGRNTFVGRYYPRAMLESQAYFIPAFVKRIKYFCKMWQQRDQSDIQDALILFRDLVAVLADYERACDALGRAPEVTVLGELGPYLNSEQFSVLQAANLDVELAMRIANEENLSAVLLKSDVEDAVVALFEPTATDRLRPDDLDRNPRLAAIVAETALRSPLLANSLTGLGTKRAFFERPSLRFPSERWADAWPIRASRFSAVLATALPFVRENPDAGSQMPHLAALERTRPIRRLRHELLFSHPPATASTVGSVVLVAAVALLIGVPWWWSVAFGIVTLPLVLAVLRLLTLHGMMDPPSSQVLGLRPSAENSPAVVDRRVRLVFGTSKTLRRFFLRRPRGNEGLYCAVYTRHLPFVWTRFCPSLGDRLSLTRGALVQQMWTEDVRKLMGGSNE